MTIQIKHKTTGEVLVELAGDTLVGADLQGVDLRYANLWRADLRGADLRGVDLRYANLWRADLRGAGLRGAYLRGADLRGADLRGAYLRGAYLRGAYLQDADLQDADLQDADLQDANLQDANLRGAYLQDANLQGANLQGADLGDKGKVQADGVFVAGPLGRSNRCLTAVHTDKGIFVMTGCFKGSLAKFRETVRRTHKANPKHEMLYLGIANIIEYKFTGRFE